MHNKKQVCGQFIKQSDKEFLDSFDGLLGGAIAGCVFAQWTCGSIAALYAAKYEVERQMGGSMGDGINKYFNSTFMDITASKNNQGPYRCEKVKVRSTNNAVVDRVRESLSYNDIQVSCCSHCLIDMLGQCPHHTVFLNRSQEIQPSGRMPRPMTRPCTTGSTATCFTFCPQRCSTK